MLGIYVRAIRENVMAEVEHMARDGTQLQDEN